MKNNYLKSECYHPAQWLVKATTAESQSADLGSGTHNFVEASHLRYPFTALIISAYKILVIT